MERLTLKQLKKELSNRDVKGFSKMKRQEALATLAITPDINTRCETLSSYAGAPQGALEYIQYRKNRQFFKVEYGGLYWFFLYFGLCPCVMLPARTMKVIIESGVLGQLNKVHEKMPDWDSNKIKLLASTVRPFDSYTANFLETGQFVGMCNCKNCRAVRYEK